MTEKILVTYSSRRGATAEIAEFIAEILRENITVDIKPVDDVTNLEGYDAVVLGSAVYIGQWMKDAAHFLESNVEELAARNTWLFSSGPTGEGDPVELMKGFLVPESLKPEVERIAPEDIAFFHGALDMKKLNFAEKMMIRGVKAPVGDFRDWEMIREWAQKIAQSVKVR